MTLRPIFLTVFVCGAIVAGCDRPKGAPAPAPEPAPVAAAPAAPVSPRPPEPIQWDETSGRFVLDGMVLKTAHLWRFDGGLEGFSAAGAKLELVPNGGLKVTEEAPDSLVRSPRNLSVDGARYNAVLVRLTRQTAAPNWDGSLYYTTADHDEMARFHGKALRGGNPVQGETTTMVYDMTKLGKGDDDWVSSTIRGLRLDLDDGAGGVFIVHQIAVVSLPATAVLQPAQ